MPLLLRHSLRAITLLLLLTLTIQAFPQENVLVLQHFRRSRTYQIKPGRMVFLHMPNSDPFASDTSVALTGRVEEISTEGLTVRDNTDTDQYYFIRYEDLHDISIRTGDRAALATVGNIAVFSLYLALAISLGGGCYGTDFIAFGSWKEFRFYENKWDFRVIGPNGRAPTDGTPPDYYDPDSY